MSDPLVWEPLGEPETLAPAGGPVIGREEHRATVPGGWLHRTRLIHSSHVAESVAFVPEPPVCDPAVDFEREVEAVLLNRLRTVKQPDLTGEEVALIARIAKRVGERLSARTVARDREERSRG